MISKAYSQRLTSEGTALRETDKEPSALATNAKLIAKSAASGLGVFAVYAVVGSVFHWLAFSIAASDIWKTLSAGPMGAHGGAGVVVLILLLFTPQGFITLLYLVGLPILCLFLGQHAALRAAVFRIFREKQGALVEFVVGASMRAITVASKAPGTERAGAVARRLLDSTNVMDASRASRFVLRALVKAIKLPEILATTDFVARSKADPDGARAELRAAVEPRIAEFATPSSYRPLLVVLAVTTAATLTTSLWCRLL
jgi:hypothetical protein